MVEAEGRESRADLLSRLVPGRKKEEDVEPAPEEAPVAHESGGVPPTPPHMPSDADSEPTPDREGDDDAGAAAGGADAAHPDRWGRAIIDVAGVDVVVADMAEYDWAEPPHEPFEAMVDVKRSADGNYVARIAWNPPNDDSEVSVYRVIAADGEQPDTDCDEVDSTVSVVTESYAFDGTAAAYPEAACRYYEIWRYRGESVAEAVAAPPYLFAQAKVIWPPIGMSAFVDNGQAMLAWDELSDAAVQYRWLRLGKRERRSADADPEVANPATAGGFVDAEAKPGEKYVYLIFTGVDGPDGTQWVSKPERVPLRVPAVLAPVLDLRLEPHPDHPGTVDLSWTPPASGKVVIFRSTRRPNPGIHEAGVVNLQVLGTPDFGLPPADAIPRQPRHTEPDGRVWMRNVALPDDASETYFTPVTQEEAQGCPGRTVAHLRLQAPGDPFLQDRVEWVLVVFEWPVGATQVNLYATDVNATIDPQVAHPIDVIRESEYKEFGGFRVERARFGSGRRLVGLAAQREQEEDLAYSPPALLECSFPALAHYGLVIRRARFGDKTQVLLTVWSPTTIPSLKLALGWRPDSLPLAPGDTQTLLARIPALEVGPERREIDLSDHLRVPLPDHGYMRLLARPEDDVALVDPPLAQLALGRGDK